MRVDGQRGILGKTHCATQFHFRGTFEPSDWCSLQLLHSRGTVCSSRMCLTLTRILASCEFAVLASRHDFWLSNRSARECTGSVSSLAITQPLAGPQEDRIAQELWRLRRSAYDRPLSENFRPQVYPCSRNHNARHPLSSISRHKGYFENFGMCNFGQTRFPRSDIVSQ
jgi:hypothetical protein